MKPKKLVNGFQALLLALLIFGVPVVSARANVITDENAANGAHGSFGWSQTAEGLHDIQGYAWPLSARPGEALGLHVSSAGGARYRVEIYCVGFYGGVGGRLIGCLPACSADEAGLQAPDPPPPDVDGQTAANWPMSERIVIGSNWASGYYVARLVLTSGASVGQATAVSFVVRSPAGTRSTVLVQVPVNTWEAYNPWGGKSLYPLNSSNGASANRVSFLRPFSLAPGTPIRIEQSPAWSEYPLVRFLEAYGYDVSYQTDLDTDREPAELTRHALVVSAGHNEYWTTSMRNAFEDARDEGVNLAFMGSNASYWLVRYENDQQTMVGYKDLLDPNPDPAARTVKWRQLGRPECRLVGVQFHVNDVGSGGDYQVTTAGARDPWLAGTGLGAGSVLPGLVKTEWDSVQPSCRNDVTTLFHFAGQPNADATRYQASSGAYVFASGSLGFGAALDPVAGVPALRVFMSNAIGDLSRPPAPRALMFRRSKQGLRITIRRWAGQRNPVRVYRLKGARARLVCRTARRACVDRRARPGQRHRYSAVSESSFGVSTAIKARSRT